MIGSYKQLAAVHEIFVGLPKTIGNPEASEPMDREWQSSIFKERAEGPVYLGKTNLANDAQADLRHHGGPEKAVFAYPAEHYAYWQKELDCRIILPGGMGENFSTVHLSEKDAAIGDVFEIGEAVIQVSQPRQPCWKPARRFRVKELAVLLQNSGRTGWYYRVLKEGAVEAGQQLKLIERMAPKWTIAACNHVMHIERENFELAAELAAVEELAVNWKATLTKRVELQQAEAIERRVFGPNVE